MKKTFLGILIALILAISACTPVPSPASTSSPAIPASASPPAYTPTAPPASPAPENPPPTPAGKTIFVTSAADGGPGSLRQGLLDAAPADRIVFDAGIFPPDQPVVIYLESSLPSMSQGFLTIDGVGAGVILDGSLFPPGWDSAIYISSSGNTVKGLRIENFSGVGIQVSSGQDNLIEHNVIGLCDAGIGLWGAAVSGNRIANNSLGVLADGLTPYPNRGDGLVIQEGAHDNQVGPGNHIAFNTRFGVNISHADTTGNTIFQNNFHDNGKQAIGLVEGGNRGLPAPNLANYQPALGSASGTTCPGCAVMVYSTALAGGLVYEGQTTADGQGNFSFAGPSAFAGSCVIATATDAGGNTSEFSPDALCAVMSIVLQDGNDSPRSLFSAKPTQALVNNRVGSLCAPHWCPIDETFLRENLFALGLKGMLRLSLNEIEAASDGSGVDWTRPEFAIDPAGDAWVSLASESLTVGYVLTFWDKQNHPNGWDGSGARFSSEENIARYLDYVRFVVAHFKGRVHYYEIWNEPDNPAPAQHLAPSEYIALVKRAAPVIKAIDPDARILLGGPMGLNSPAAQEYLFALLNSEIMPLVDGIAWHPFFGVSPEYQGEYYYAYPALVQQIKAAAAAHGFAGEYRADELTWRTTGNPGSDQPTAFSNGVAATYYLRGMILNLGMGVDVGVMVDPRFWEIRFAVGNLNTLLDQSEPADIALEIHSQAEKIARYGFALPDGDRLVALWSDVAASDDAPGTASTVTFPGLAGWSAVGMDMKHGFEQHLVTASTGDDLVIANFLIRDYPVFIRLSKQD